MGVKENKSFQLVLGDDLFPIFEQLEAQNILFAGVKKIGRLDGKKIDGGDLREGKAKIFFAGKQTKQKKKFFGGGQGGNLLAKLQHVWTLGKSYRQFRTQNWEFPVYSQFSTIQISIALNLPHLSAATQVKVSTTTFVFGWALQISILELYRVLLVQLNCLCDL